MNLNHLAIFHAVAQEGNLTRAAQKLCISQPAVSKQLRLFEKSLGTALFHRLSRGVQLTEAGLLLHEYSTQLFALQNDAERALAELRGLQRGRLRVGASTTIGIYLLPQILGRFRELHPKIELSLSISNHEQLQADVRAERIDLALSEGPVLGKEWQVEPFLVDEIVAIAPPGHALCARKTLTQAEVCQQPLLWREAGSGTRSVVEAALQESQTRYSVSMSLGSTEALKRAVMLGMGVAFVSRLCVERELAAGTLVALEIKGFQIERPLQRLRLRGNYESRAAREFVHLLRASTRGK